MKKVGIAIIGLGYWGPNLVRNFLKNPDAEIAYICDNNQSHLNKVSREYPFLQTAKDYKHVLKDPAVELVAIATPVSTHYKLAREALTCNKHVFIEKPMAQTSREAASLLKIAKKKGRMIMVGHTFIYSSAVEKIKQYIDHKQLGDLYYYDSIRINLGGFQSDTNVLWDLATHDLAILSYIFPQKALSVYVTASKHIHKKYEEVAHIFLKYPNNVFAHIHVSWLSPVKIRTILIGGSRKMVVYNDIEPSEKLKVYTHDVVSHSHVTPFSPAYRSGDVVIPKLSQTETMFTQLSDAVICVQTGKTPRSSGEQGLEVVRLLEACQKSLAQTKEIKL